MPGERVLACTPQSQSPAILLISAKPPIPLSEVRLESSVAKPWSGRW
jgi:hypothetical protein